MPLIERDCDVIYKVLIVGDSGVGKTAILDCLMGRDFNESSRPTVGVDFVRKIVEADGALVQLRIWDTAGLEKFRSITRLQYRGVQGLIVVYDVTNETSFHSIEYWLSNIQHMRTPDRHPYEPLPFLVVGNKSDVIGERKVSMRQGSKLAKREMAFGFYEISAKTGANVFKTFHSLAYHITDITHPKLMKSYHPNFIRPVGVKPRTTADATNRLSAPCFSSTAPPTPTVCPRQRYSLWDPMIPWMPYNVPTPQTSPRKKRLKRLKMSLPFLKMKRKKKKKKKSQNGDDGIFIAAPGTSSKSKAATAKAGQSDQFGSKANNGFRRHEKKRFRKFFRPKIRGKKKSQKKSGLKKGKVKSAQHNPVKRRLKFNGAKDGSERKTQNTQRNKTFKTRIIHFLCSCFIKQKAK